MAVLAFKAAPMVRILQSVVSIFIYKYSHACKGKYTGLLLTRVFMYIANRLSTFTETICSRAVNPYHVREGSYLKKIFKEHKDLLEQRDKQLIKKFISLYVEKVMVFEYYVDVVFKLSPLLVERSHGEPYHK